MFFYYFAIILIIGAQINAHFYEDHPPFDNPLGTYLSKRYEEHLDNNDDHQTPTMTDDDDKENKVGCINKLWPFKKRNSIKPKLEEHTND